MAHSITSLRKLSGMNTHLLAHGARFAEEPRLEPCGLLVVFLDLCGNKRDPVQYDIRAETPLQ